jgi:hypothetical protein
LFAQHHDLIVIAAQNRLDLLAGGNPETVDSVQYESVKETWRTETGSDGPHTILKSTLEQYQIPVPSTCNAKSLLRKGWCDPVRVFVKQEPHTSTKLKQERYRLIMSVSVVDQIIDRLLFSSQNSKEIDNWATLSAKPGMGLTDAHVETLAAHVTKLSKGKKIAETDMSAWDWTVPDWLMDMDMYRRLMLAENANMLFDVDRLEKFLDKENFEDMQVPEMAAVLLSQVTLDLKSMIVNRYACLKHKVFSLSDGTLIQQRIPGIQVTGSLNTSSTNSAMRIMLAYTVGVPWIIAMGDDAVEGQCQDNAGVKKRYEAYGFKCKMYHERTLAEGFSFCSTWFYQTPFGWRARAESWPRTFYRMLNAKVQDQERFNQFVADLRRVPELSACVQLLISVGWGGGKIRYFYTPLDDLDNPDYDGAIQKSIETCAQTST